MAEITKETPLSEQTIYNEAILRFMVTFSQKERTNPTEAANEAKRFADKYFETIDWLDAPDSDL